jgi:hypothetical protein
LAPAKLGFGEKNLKMLLLHIHAGRVANFPGLFLKLETEVWKQSNKFDIAAGSS